MREATGTARLPAASASAERRKGSVILSGPPGAVPRLEWGAGGRRWEGEAGMRRGRKAAGRPLLIGALALAVVGGTLGLYWFQPWKLWQDETVDEALPGAVTTASPPGAVTTSPPPAAAPAPSPTRDAGPRTVAGGELVSHEHSTSGTAQLVRLTDGSHVVRLENLDTSNGPDVHVWLTDAPVKEEGRLAPLRRRGVRRSRQVEGQQGQPELRRARRRRSLPLHQRQRLVRPLQRLLRRGGTRPGLMLSPKDLVRAVAGRAAARRCRTTRDAWVVMSAIRPRQASNSVQRSAGRGGARHESEPGER